METAWKDAVAEPADSIDAYLQTIRELCDSMELGTALKLGSAMVDSLESKGRSGDAARIAFQVVEKDAHNENFARRLFGLLKQEHGDAAWFDLALSLSGLKEDDASADSLRAFDRARRFTPGHVLYHRSGWGEGLVEEIDVNERQITVRFVSGGEKELPLQSALDTLRPLADDDLRAMRLCRAEELQRIAAEEPAVLIRIAAKMYRGRINSQQLKAELSPSVIPTKKWATWWKKAKIDAANDPWLRIEGSKTRPVFELRRQPLSLAQEARRTIDHAQNLPEAIETCRDYLARGLDDAARDTILDIALERVEAELEKGEESPAHLLDGILFIAEHGRETSVPAALELRALLGGDEAFNPAAIRSLATQKSREHAAKLLPEALGEDWADQCIEAITEFPSSVIEVIVDQLSEAGHAARLVSAWAAVAPYPKRYPVLTFLLGRHYADKVFDEQTDKPKKINVGRVLLHLARVITKERKGDADMARIRARLTGLLVGRRDFLQACIDGISRDDLANYLGICERGGNDFPQEITDTILRAVARLYPDITSKPERPFWEQDDHIYVTSAGLKHQKELHRTLVDQKIPENAKAIQNAASYGDLSENSEWEAAMEEQRNLTGRAEEISTDLRKARLIEDQQIPDGVVTPGTRVEITFLDTGESGNYRILGPWDCVEADVVNYKAPLAAAMLGHRIGAEVTVEGPDGEQKIRINTIERVI